MRGLSQTPDFLLGAAATLVLLYFLLASGDLFLRKAVKLLPRLRDKKRAVEIIRQMEGEISTYLLTITTINVSLGIAVGIAMALIGEDPKYRSSPSISRQGQVVGSASWKRIFR